MGWFVGTAFGVNYSERTKDKSSPETGLSTIDGLAYQIADEFLLSPTNLSYADAGEALALNVPGVLAEYFNPIVYGNPNSLPYLAGKYWDVEEEVLTAYVRADMSHEISDTVTLTGNVGVQFIATDQQSSSFFVAYPFTADQVVRAWATARRTTTSFRSSISPSCWKMTRQCA